MCFLITTNQNYLIRKTWILLEDRTTFDDDAEKDIYEWKCLVQDEIEDQIITNWTQTKRRSHLAVSC